jgi:hypothetical protein
MLLQLDAMELLLELDELQDFPSRSTQPNFSSSLRLQGDMSQRCITPSLTKENMLIWLGQCWSRTQEAG